MLFTNNGADFSEDRLHRNYLWRIWDLEKPLCMFIGLNPSTADGISDDPTIRRVKRFSSDWGFGGVYMLNLFSFITAYPEELFKCQDPIRDSDAYLKEMADKCDRIVCAWGNFKVNGRDAEVKKILHHISDEKQIMALQINANGTPKHPLYVKADIQPVKFIGKDAKLR